MRHKVKEKTGNYVAEDQCRHYWIIEAPEGPTSKGVCKFCGAEKEFDSFGPDSLSRWDRSPSKYVDPPVLPDLAPAEKQDDS